MSIREVVLGWNSTGSSFGSNDAHVVATINKIFSATSLDEHLSAVEIDDAMELFKVIQTDKAKLQAFAAAISPGKDSTDLKPDPGQQFYKALPQHLQEKFKDALWAAIDDSRRRGSDRDDFVRRLIDSKITGSETAKRAIQAML